MKVLVYGWYGNSNLGDEAFKDAFIHLFPQFEFTFKNHIPKNVNDYDAVWFGGGSFLDGPFVNPSGVEITKPIAFIGVGLPSKPEGIPAYNQKLLRQAQLVLLRDSQSTRVAEAMGVKATTIPDLAFATPNLHPKNTQSKRITVFCNDIFTPRTNAPEYKVLSYYWFVSEFSEACNLIIKQGYTIDFVPMGVGDIDDRRFAAIIHSRIEKKSKANWHLTPFTHSDFEKIISESELVISQRFHGVVFSIKYGVPFVCISAADKFHTLMSDMGAGSYLDYYGFTKPRFFDAMSKNNTALTDKFYQSSVAAFQSVQKTVLELFSVDRIQS